MLTPPSGRRDRRLRDESGLGLVEVLVAMVITGMVLSALAQTLIGSFRSVAVSEERLRATQIAAEAIENVQALDWDAIGFYDDQVPDPVIVDGVSTWTYVTLGSVTPTPAPASLQRQTRTVTLDGTTYTVLTAIVWDDVPPTTTDEMVRKRLHVTVSWATRGSTRSVSASSYVALPGSSVQPGFFYMVLATAGAPYQLIDDNGGPVTALGVPVPVVLAAETNRGASGVTAAWTNRDGTPGAATLTQTLNPQTWTWTETGATFVNGPTTFSFTATPANASYATDTQNDTVTFLHRNVVPVTAPVATSGLNGAGRLCVGETNAKTFSPLVLQVEVQGYLTSDTATVGNGVGTWPGITTSTTTRGVVQRITVPSGTTIVHALGQATFTLTVARTSALPSGANVSTFTIPVHLAANSGACA